VFRNKVKDFIDEQQKKLKQKALRFASTDSKTMNGFPGTSEVINIDSHG